MASSTNRKIAHSRTASEMTTASASKRFHHHHHHHSRTTSESEPLLLIHPRQEHGDGAMSPSSVASFGGDGYRGRVGSVATVAGGGGGGPSEQQQHHQASLIARIHQRLLESVGDSNVDAGGEDEGLLRTGGSSPGNDGSPLVATSSPSSSAGLFVWLLTVSACVSGLLFGYDTGVISATLVSIGTSLSNRGLTSLDKSLITSVTALFGLIASPLSSVLADRWGRRPVILLADVLFIVGALVQAAASSVGVMILGRAVVGAAVGASSFVTPLYIAELSPARLRGRLVTMNVLCITLGQVVAYIVGWFFAEHWDATGGAESGGGNGWRWMVGLGALPAAAQVALLMAWMPETPRWLVKAGRSEEAESVIRKTMAVAGQEDGDDEQEDEASTSLLAIEAEVRAEAEERAKLLRRRQAERSTEGGGDHEDEDGPLRDLLAGWHELFDVTKNRRALTIACLLQGLQQLCGFNSLMYFSATIFELLGFRAPTLTSMTVAGTNFIFTVLALLLIDRIGRRRILLYSIPFMVLGLLLAAIGFRYVQLSSPATPDSTITTTTITSAAAAPLVILTSMMLFTASYALGLGNVPWMQSELFPLSVRSLGSGLATSTNWLANFVVGLTFLPLMMDSGLTPSWTFVLYAIVCAAGWFAVWKVYPETAGLTLEEAANLLGQEDWGVGRSRRIGSESGRAEGFRAVRGGGGGGGGRRGEYGGVA